VTGIGGIFFKAKDPKALVQWYRRHLGIDIEDTVALFTWRSGKDGKAKGATVWSSFLWTRNTLVRMAPPS